MNYKFTQIYLYGDNWDGEIVNIPDNAVFYNISSLTPKQQEWYVLIPLDDNNIYESDSDDEELDNREDYQGDGCAQVITYYLCGYAIIHLQNITPIGEWNNIGEDKFRELFDNIFNEYYVYEYSQAQFKTTINENCENILEYMTFEKIEDEQLLSANRMKTLEEDGYMLVTSVNLKDKITKNDMFGITPGNYSLSDLEEAFLKDSISYIIGDRKLVISKDSKIYDETFKLVSEKLY